MNARLIAVSSVAVVGLGFAAAWLFEMPLDRALVLSPVIVVGTGIVTMTAALLVRAAIDSARELSNPRRFWLGFAIALVLIGILAVLGVELPREG